MHFLINSFIYYIFGLLTSQLILWLSWHFSSSYEEMYSTKNIFHWDFYPNVFKDFFSGYNRSYK